MGGPGDMTGLPLVVGADVDQLGAALDQLAGLLAGDLAVGRPRFVSGAPQSTSVPSTRKATRT